METKNMMEFKEEEFMACCGSRRFAEEMEKACPFPSLEEAIVAARDIWFNKVNVNGWLQAFSVHPQIGHSPPSSSLSTFAQLSFPLSFLFFYFPSSLLLRKSFHLSLITGVICVYRNNNNKNDDEDISENLGFSQLPVTQIRNMRFLLIGNDGFCRWSKGEQSTALSTATSSSLQELSEWNARYKEKFGFLFLICASGRSTDEILAELKIRYPNRPIVEFEIAAGEQMKITELRLAKLFSTKTKGSSTGDQYSEAISKKAEDRMSIIGGHLAAALESSVGKTYQRPTRTRPPITTHVLDVSRGSPGAGIEVCLEAWKGPQPRPIFGDPDMNGWVTQGSSFTDNDGRSGQLMSMVDAVNPGIYRISFNTGKYCSGGFFPYVSIVFEIRESQKLEHFHVPLLLSPFSFTTYRGS